LMWIEEASGTPVVEDCFSSSMSRPTKRDGPSALAVVDASIHAGYARIQLKRKLAPDGANATFSAHERFPIVNGTRLRIHVTADGKEGARPRSTMPFSRGAVDLDLLADDPDLNRVDYSSVILIRKLHGFVMFFNYALCLTAGAVIARYFRHSPHWYVWHRRLQTLGSLGSYVVVGMAWYSNVDAEHLRVRHSQFALGLVLISLVQATTGFLLHGGIVLPIFYPGRNESNNGLMIKRLVIKLPEMGMHLRAFVKLCHRWFGKVALFSSAYVMHLGLTQLRGVTELPRAFIVCFYAVICADAAIVFMLEARFQWRKIVFTILNQEEQNQLRRFTVVSSATGEVMGTGTRRPKPKNFKDALNVMSAVEMMSSSARTLTSDTRATTEATTTDGGVTVMNPLQRDAETLAPL